LFGLSGWEIAIIALFGFMIFGPDKLPQIARTAGRAIRQFRTAQEQMNKVIKAEVYDPLKDLEPLANPFAGFSLEESKTNSKKQGAAKPAAKDGEKAKTSKATEDKAPEAASGKPSDAKAAAGAADEVQEKKLSSDALKAAISEEAEKAKEKALQSTAEKTVSSTPATESFAQRRARLEREHAKAKAAATPASDDRKEDGEGA
jgi:TatA/E family protein of Tat protein translocase